MRLAGFTNKLILGDCLVEMQKLDKCVSLVICDMPYNCTQAAFDKNIIDLDLFWKNIDSILIEGGIVILFGSGIFTAKLIMSKPKMFKYSLVWDKHLTSGFLNAKRMPLRRHEDILVFYNKNKTYNPQFTIGKPLHGRGKSPCINKNSIYGEFGIGEDRTGSTMKYPTSIIEINKTHPSKSIHPTEKPVALMEYLIKTYSNAGDIVFDGFMGCGSTGVACKNLGRSFIGCEIDKKYFDLAVKRCECLQ